MWCNYDRQVWCNYNQQVLLCNYDLQVWCNYNLQVWCSYDPQVLLCNYDLQVWCNYDQQGATVQLWPTGATVQLWPQGVVQYDQQVLLSNYDLQVWCNMTYRCFCAIMSSGCCYMTVDSASQVSACIYQCIIFHLTKRHMMILLSMDEGTLKTPIPYYRLHWSFCLGWWSSLVDSESGQKQSAKFLQNMVYSTIQPPPPQTHTVCIYCTFSLGRG